MFVTSFMCFFYFGVSPQTPLKNFFGKKFLRISKNLKRGLYYLIVRSKGDLLIACEKGGWYALNFLEVFEDF